MTLFAAISAGSFTASADPPSTASTTRPSPEGPRAIYRFDITVRTPEDAPNAHLPTYTLNLEENHTGLVSVGANIPLQTSGGSTAMVAPRQDIGLMLRLSFVMQGTNVVLTGNVEMSGAEPSANGPVSIHHIRADGVVPLTPGRAGLFTSLADTTSHRTYEIMVTATRLL